VLCLPRLCWPAFVGRLHHWFLVLRSSRCQPPIVSPMLSHVTADRRLLFTTSGHIYRPCRRRSPSTVLVSLLLLLGGVEPNPGPAAFTTPTGTAFGLLNARSAPGPSRTPVTERRPEAGCPRVHREVDHLGCTGRHKARRRTSWLPSRSSATWVVY